MTGGCLATLVFVVLLGKLGTVEDKNNNTDSPASSVGK